MKKSKLVTIIIGIVLSIALILSCLGYYISKRGDVPESAARRELGEPSDVVIIDDNLVALAGELNGSPEAMKAARDAFDAINAKRAENGLGQLIWSDGLAQAASVRAVESSTLWSHNRPDGTEYWTVNSALVYGENLAMGFSSGQEAFNAWMASPTHKDNILFGQFRTAAIAVHIAADGKWYWANEFGY